MALVFDAEGLTSGEKMLLLAYTNFTDAHGYCWPGLKRLMRMAGMSKMTVIRTRKGLEAKNLLRHQKRYTEAGDRMTNYYRVNLSKLRAMRGAPIDFGDNEMALVFEDDPSDPVRLMPSTPADLPKYQIETTPAHFETTLSQDATTGGLRMRPPSSQDETQSVIDPEVDPSVTDARAGQTEATALEVTENHRTAATALVQQVDLSLVDAKQSQVWQIRDGLARAFAAGYSAGQITVYLRAKLAEARTVRYLLGAFETHRLGDIAGVAASQPVPPVCGQCDARKSDPVSARVVWLDDDHTRSAPCPRCHPGALSSV